jgi:uncharacterized protein YjbJ (UPF0337 family)
MKMNSIEHNWEQIKGFAKKKWGKLTDDKLDTIAGQPEQLAASLQESYGITKDQAEVQVAAFEEAHKNDPAKASA